MLHCTFCSVSLIFIILIDHDVFFTCEAFVYMLWRLIGVTKLPRFRLSGSFQLPCCSNLISARFTTSSFMLISIISSTGYRRSATAGWLSNTRCLVCRIARKMVPAQARCPPRNSSCYQPHFAVIAALYCFHALRARLQGNQLASSSKRGDLPGGSATWSP